MLWNKVIQVVSEGVQEGCDLLADRKMSMKNKKRERREQKWKRMLLIIVKILALPNFQIL